MAVTLKGLRPGYPRAEFSLTGRKYTVQWVVHASSYDDGPLQAQSASGLPSAYDSYNIGNDSDDEALIRSWSAFRSDDNSLEWYVEAIYSTPEAKDGSDTGTGQGTHEDTAGAFENPLLEKAAVKTWSIEKEVPIERVYNLNTGRFNPPMNSACQIQTLLKKDRYLAISISRNEAVSTIHPALGVTMELAINADVFWGFLPGLVQCQHIVAERQIKQVQGASFPYLKVEYLFHVRRDGWDTVFLDAGDYYCPCEADGGGAGSGCAGSGAGSGGSLWCEDDEGQFFYCGGTPGSGSGYDTGHPCTACGPTVRRAFTDLQGHPRKGLLNGRGGQLPAGGTPVWGRLRVYPWRLFTPLALPQSFASVQ